MRFLLIYEKHLLYLLIVAVVWSVNAQYPSAGSVNYQHLLVSYDGRSAALAGAGVAVPGGIEMALQNPAVISSKNGNNALVGYQNIGLGVWNAVLGYSRTFSYGTFALLLQGLSSGDVEVWNEVNGLPEQTDLVANIKYLTPSLVYSRSFFNKQLFVGASMKGMYHRIYNGYTLISSKAIGFDLGIQYRQFSNRFTAAAVFRNIGYEFQTFNSDERYPTPFLFEAGISYIPRYLPHVRFIADVNKTRGTYISYEPAIELDIYPDIFTIRAGYAFSHRDLREQLKTFSGEKDDNYIKSNFYSIAFGIGIQTTVQNTKVQFDIAIQTKTEGYPANVLISSNIEF